MPISIDHLPHIASVIPVQGAPHFIVLRYDHFVRLAASSPEIAPPDAVTILDLDEQHVFIVLLYDEYRSYIAMVPVIGEVDEAHYLATHADVNLAVSDGRLVNGTQHFLVQGYFEQRAVAFPKADATSN
jgi:hypothetical protein